MLNKLGDIVKNIKLKNPLIQIITNYVTINDIANGVLAFGASPAMIEGVEEAYEFAKVVDALYLNLGTLNHEQKKSMLLAHQGACEKGIPVILDPAGCGAIPSRIDFVRTLYRQGKIDLIKGNSGEILSLAGKNARVRGIDSFEHNEEIEKGIQEVSNQYRCVTAATGKIDLISDGKQTVKIFNHNFMLKMVAGMGCMVGALCASACGVEKDTFFATVCGTLAVTIAGEMAYEKAKTPGNFKVEFINAIYQLDERIIASNGNLQII